MRTYRIKGLLLKLDDFEAAYNLTKKRWYGKKYNVLRIYHNNTWYQFGCTKEEGEQHLKGLMEAINKER